MVGDRHNQKSLFGTGEFADYRSEQLEGLQSKDGCETQLYRIMSSAEYANIVEHNGIFLAYEWAMEKKWFATCVEHAAQWATLLYPDGSNKTLEITVLNEALKYMFYVKALDNIGPAYAADVELLNAIVRRVRLV